MLLTDSVHSMPLFSSLLSSEIMPFAGVLMADVNRSRHKGFQFPAEHLLLLAQHSYDCWQSAVLQTEYSKGWQGLGYGFTLLLSKCLGPVPAL